jgi:hypothetical protein
VIFNDPTGKGHRINVTEPNGRIIFGATWAPDEVKA